MSARSSATSQVTWRRLAGCARTIDAMSSTETTRTATPDHDGHDEHADEGLAVDLPLLVRSAGIATPVAVGAEAIGADRAEPVDVDAATVAGTVVPLGLARPFGRRGFLRAALGGAGAAALLAACGSDAASSASSSASSSATASTDAATTTAAGTTATAGTGSTSSAGTVAAGEAIPSETAGPFPGDGTNGPDALTAGGVVRSDIRSSFGADTGTAEGVTTTFDLTIVEASTGEPIPGATVYLWHCDAEGRYSLYDLPDQNYLRGVQEAGADGLVSFTSIFPGCYSGRWPHAHFEIFSSLDEATVGTRAVTTTQLAMPEDACDAVYATSGYESSSGNLARTSLARDMVFSDGVDSQMVTIAGSVDGGYTASLVVRI